MEMSGQILVPAALTQGHIACLDFSRRKNFLPLSGPKIRTMQSADIRHIAIATTKFQLLVRCVDYKHLEAMSTVNTGARLSLFGPRTVLRRFSAQSDNKFPGPTCAQF